MKPIYAALLLVLVLTGCANPSEPAKPAFALDSREAWSHIGPPDQRCPVDGIFNDELVAASIHLSVERLARLKRLRALDNAEVCGMPTRKLQRALAKTEIIQPDHPAEARRFRAMQQQDEHGVVDPEGLLRAMGQRNRVLRDLAADANPMAGISSGQWSAMGPGNIGGRVRAIAVHPTDSNKIWVGSIGGGIWASTNAGVSWAAVNDFLPNLAISTIVIDPSNPSVMYAGTGEGFFNADALRGLGIFKSVDGGLSWSQIASTAPGANSDWYYVNRIAIHPSNGNIILAGTNGGTYRSADGGASWTKVSSVRTLDVKFDPNNGNNALRGRADGAVSYSNDAGATWTVSVVVTTTSSVRVEIAYAKSTSNLVYASVDTNNGTVYKSTDGGVNWTLVATPAHLSSQGWYANTIAVSPVDANRIVVGGLDLYTSSNGSSFTKISTWQYSPVSPHADHHVIVVDPGFNGTSNKKVYVGNDGGVYRTNDITTATSGPSASSNGWSNLNNGFAVTQFYSGAGYTGGKIIGGTQDNGALLYPGSGSDWLTFNGGDGGYSAVDSGNSNYLYGEYVYLDLYRSTNGGSTTADICSGISDANADYCGGTGEANFIAPFALDPNNNNRMLAGGSSLWASDNVKAATPSWRSIKAPTTATTSNKYISAIAVAPGNAGVIWVGHNNGNLFRTTNGTATTPSWTQVTATLPARMVTRIYIDQADVSKVYVMYGGYSSGNIQRTSDGGTTWTDISGVLPQAPIRGFARHPNSADWLYVGSEVGVFASQDGGNNWFTTNDGPAAVSVDELFWLDNTTLAAATHGRGMFKTTVSAVTGAPQCSLIPSATSISLGSSVSLTASCSPAATSYAWTAAAGLVPGSGNTASVTPTAAGVFQYSVVGSNASGAGNTASVMVTVTTSTATIVPVCTLTASPGTINAGASSTLSATCSPAATSYAWTNTGFSSSASGGSVTPTATTTYSVIGSNAAGAGSSVSVTVSVTPVAPQCSLSASPSAISAGASSTLTATCTPAATSYAWTNTGFSSTAASGSVTPATTTIYSVVGRNAAGAGNTAQAAVIVGTAVASSTDVRTYVPAASAASGYVSYLRVINTGTAATPVLVAKIDGGTGSVGASSQLTPSLPAGAAVTYSAQQVEAALGSTMLAADRPRIRVAGAIAAVEVQSFLLQPGGVFNEISGANSGSSVQVSTYVPAAASSSGYVSYLRVINTGSSTTTVTVARIDPATGLTGTAGTLNASLPAGAAITYSATQVEAALGATIAASERPRIAVSGSTNLEVQSFLIQPGGAFTNISTEQSGSSIDVRSYVPAAASGYTTYLRVVNASGGATPITATLMDDATGLAMASGTLIASLPGNGAATLSSSQVEAALGTSIAAGSRPRIRISSPAGTASLRTQSFLLQPGGAYNEMSNAISGVSTNVRTYLPAADSAGGYTSYLRVINPTASTTAVTIALIDGATGAAGSGRTLIASLPGGGAQTFSSSQIEAVLGATIAAGSRPRLQVSGSVALEVQSFLTQPGGAFTEVSGGQ